MSTEDQTPALPLYTLDVQAMDLGAATKAIGLELIETESREPVRGPEAARIWGAVIPALAVQDPWVIDFFSHLERVRDFCKLHEIAFRAAATRSIVIAQPSNRDLRRVLERFERETFGIRVGPSAATPDPEVEAELSRQGLEAYQAAYSRYCFCAVCELEDGWVTLLSESLWPSEVIRRVRSSVQPFDVYLLRPQ